MTRLTATLYGPALDGSAYAAVATVREARAWAESRGDGADQCEVTAENGRVVARHVRNTSGKGRRWHRAAP